MDLEKEKPGHTMLRKSIQVKELISRRNELQRLEHGDNSSTLVTCRVMESPWHTLRDTVMGRQTLQKGNKERNREGAAGTAISLGTK